MRQAVHTFERAARYTMSVVAILAVLAGIALRMGWINKAPFYDHDRWYLESSYSSFSILSEYDSEAECRKDEKPFTICRSGKMLSEEARSRDSAIRL